MRVLSKDGRGETLTEKSSEGLADPMTKLMDEAIDALRHVPAEQQDEIALLVLRLAGGEPAIYVLSAEEEADIAESDAAAQRGEFATDEEVRAIWAKYGL